MRQRRQKRKRVVRLALLLSVVITILFFIFRGEKKQTILPARTVNFTQQQTATPTDSPIPTLGVPEKSIALGQTIADALEGTKGTYGIVVWNLKTNEYYAQNELQTFDSGSLYKLWVMATVFGQIKQGKLNKKQILTKDVVQLNKSFGVTPDPLEQTTGKLQQSVEDALNNMITISSNNSALLLTDVVKVSSIADFLKHEEFSNSKVGIEGKAPTTTALDIAAFFLKLYKKQLISEDASDEMLGLLKQQKLNNKLPKYLPDSIEIAHKTGELNEFTHDAGIVFSDSGEYIIVVLSKSDNPVQAEERISLVSQHVYNYFSNQITPEDQ